MNFVSLVFQSVVHFFYMGRDIALAPDAFSDLALPPAVEIADEENAYTYFVQIPEAVVFPDPGNGIGTDEFRQYFYRNKTNATLVAKALAENETTLRLIQQAAQCEWSVPPAATNFAGVLEVGQASALMQTRELSVAKIKYAVFKNDFDTAIDDMQTLLRCGHLARQMPRAFLNWLLGWKCEESAMCEMRNLSRNPQLGEQHFRRMLGLLDDIPSYAASMQDVMKTEFWSGMMMLDEFEKETFDKLPDHPVKSFILNHNYLPNRTRLLLAQTYRPAIRELPKNYSDAMRLVDREYKSKEPATWELLFIKNVFGKQLLGIITISTEDLVVYRCRYDADVAATKIIVACHLFQRATGRKPATLDELVPDYLPAVPPDPFDGAPFRYNPELGVIYSVGKSLTDFGGTDPTPPERLRGNPWRGKNAIFHIWEEPGN